MTGRTVLLLTLLGLLWPGGWLVSQPTYHVLEVDQGGGWTNTAIEIGETLQARQWAPPSAWSILAVDAHVIGGPGWLDDPEPILLNPSTFEYPNHEFEIHGSSPSTLVQLKKPVFQWFLDRAISMGGTPSEMTSVHSWCVPHFVGSTALSPRIWASNPPVWLYSGGQYAGESQLIWSGVNTPDSSGTPIPDVFSTEALFRWAVLLREVTDPAVPEGAADQFFHSAAYKAYSTQNLRLRLQGLFVIDNNPLTPTTIWSSVTVPRRPSEWPPLSALSLTPPVTGPVSIPNPRSTAPTIIELTGSVTANALHYFTARRAVPPLIVYFQSAAGPELIAAEAMCSSTLTNPLRYKVAIPDEVGVGPIVVKDNRELTVGVGYASQVVN